MLQLRTNKYNSVYNNNYYAGIANRLDIGTLANVRLQNHSQYFRGPNSILHADLPIKMMGYNFNRHYFAVDLDREIPEDFNDTIKNRLLQMFNNNEDCIDVITCFMCDNTLETPDYNYEFIDTDLWKEHKDDAIKVLYNKCAEQTSLRETERQYNTNIKQHIRVFQSKTKHMILILTDYNDVDQESEIFLTLGLTPILFEDLKPNFCEEELGYFKTLVNRSQVKRISNVKATNSFYSLENLEKYYLVERTIRYKTLFKKLAQVRSTSISNSINEKRRSAERALQDYEIALKDIKDYEILLEKYNENQDALVEELKKVSEFPYVYDLNSYNSQGIKITLRVPLDYYDMDEAECAIRNVQDENVKRFIKEIFLEQKYKLIARVDAYYSYNKDDGFTDFGYIDEQRCMEINAMYNPHFQYYHCLGDYKPSLIKAMKEQDIIMFTNVAIAAARSINFKDGAVMNRWLGDLINVFSNSTHYLLDMKCLEKDGEIYSLKQWLNNNFETTETINIIEPEDI
jgi:hypothetical protein